MVLSASTKSATNYYVHYHHHHLHHQHHLNTLASSSSNNDNNNGNSSPPPSSVNAAAAAIISTSATTQISLDSSSASSAIISSPSHPGTAAAGNNNNNDNNKSTSCNQHHHLKSKKRLGPVNLCEQEEEEEEEKEESNQQQLEKSAAVGLTTKTGPPSLSLDNNVKGSLSIIMNDDDGTTTTTTATTTTANNNISDCLSSAIFEMINIDDDDDGLICCNGNELPILINTMTTTVLKTPPPPPPPHPSPNNQQQHHDVANTSSSPAPSESEIIMADAAAADRKRKIIGHLDTILELDGDVLLFNNKQTNVKDVIILRLEQQPPAAAQQQQTSNSQLTAALVDNNCSNSSSSNCLDDDEPVCWHKNSCFKIHPADDDDDFVYCGSGSLGDLHEEDEEEEEEEENETSADEDEDEDEEGEGKNNNKAKDDEKTVADNNRLTIKPRLNSIRSINSDGGGGGGKDNNKISLGGGENNVNFDDDDAAASSHHRYQDETINKEGKEEAEEEEEEAAKLMLQNAAALTEVNGGGGCSNNDHHRQDETITQMNMLCYYHQCKSSSSSSSSNGDGGNNDNINKSKTSAHPPLASLEEEEEEEPEQIDYENCQNISLITNKNKESAALMPLLNDNNNKSNGYYYYYYYYHYCDYCRASSTIDVQRTPPPPPLTSSYSSSSSSTPPPPPPPTRTTEENRTNNNNNNTADESTYVSGFRTASSSSLLLPSSSSALRASPTAAIGVNSGDSDDESSDEQERLSLSKLKQQQQQQQQQHHQPPRKKSAFIPVATAAVAAATLMQAMASSEVAMVSQPPPPPPPPPPLPPQLPQLPEAAVSMPNSATISPTPATCSSPPAMRSRPRLPAISYIHRQPGDDPPLLLHQQQSSQQPSPIQQQPNFGSRPQTASPALAAMGSDPFIADSQASSQVNISVLKSDFAQKYRRPLVSPVRRQHQLQACSPPPVALAEHLANKQRRKLSSPLIFRPINDGYPVQPLQPLQQHQQEHAIATSMTSYGSPNGEPAFSYPASTVSTSTILAGSTSSSSTVTASMASTTSSSSRETLVAQPQQQQFQPMPMPINLSSSTSPSPSSQQQQQPQSQPSQQTGNNESNAQHVSRRIKSLADRLRGSSFESSPESSKNNRTATELVESSSSEEQRILSISASPSNNNNNTTATTTTNSSSNKRPRSQSPRLILSGNNKAFTGGSVMSSSPNSLTGNIQCSPLSSSMESQGFSEALTTSTDSAGSATQTTSTAGTGGAFSSSSGTVTNRGGGSVASTMTSHSTATVVRHHSEHLRRSSPSESGHSPAADSSTTGEYNVSEQSSASRRQSLMMTTTQQDDSYLQQQQQVIQPQQQQHQGLPPSRISTLTRRKPRLDVFGLDLLAKRGSVDVFSSTKTSDESLNELQPFTIAPSASRRPSRGTVSSGRFLTHPIAKVEATSPAGSGGDEQGSNNQLNSDSQIASQSPTTGLMQLSLLSEQSASCGNVDELVTTDDQVDDLNRRKKSSSAGSFPVEYLSDLSVQDEKPSALSPVESAEFMANYGPTTDASVEFIRASEDHQHEQFAQIHMTSRRGGSKKQRRLQAEHEHDQEESTPPEPDQQLRQRPSVQLDQGQDSLSSISSMVAAAAAAAAATTSASTSPAPVTATRLNYQTAHRQKMKPAISPAPAPTPVSSRLAEIFGSSRSTVVGATAAFHRPAPRTSSTSLSTSSAASATTPTTQNVASVTSASVLQTSMSSLHSQQSADENRTSSASRQISAELLDAGPSSGEPSLRGSSPNKDATPVPPPQHIQAPVPKRKLIIDEFYSVEKEYVEALKILVEKYLSPLKAQDVLETSQVDDIFYKIPEFYAHHSIFLTFLEKAWKNWHDFQTIGDIINMIFSKESVVECYVSFIENYSRSEKALETALQTNSAFKKFVDVRQRESRTKLDLKSLIIQPAQRLPRYLLLLKRLISNTTEEHPDYKHLGMAEKTIHNLTEKIEQSKKGESLLDTLRRIEQTLLPDQQLCSPDRYYIRQDIVQIQGRKEQTCIWLFSDLAIFSTFKRKGGPTSGSQRKSILLNTPFGQDFVDLLKHKTWLRIGLDDLELKMVPPNALKKSSPEQARIEADMQVLQQIIVLLRQLSADQLALTEHVSELLQARNRQIIEITNRCQQSLMEMATLDLIATTPQGEFTLTIGFINPEKKQNFEGSFLEARQRLSAISGRRIPQFINYLPVMKIRQGMTFSFCVATEDLNNFNCRDIWIVNSDGYLDNVCLLTLQPEPNVSQNTPLPGCSGQIYCLCAVPATGIHVGQRDYGGRSKTAMPGIALVKAASKEQASSANAIGEESDTESSGQSENDDEELRRQQHATLTPAAQMSTSSSSAGSQLQVIPTAPGTCSTVNNPAMSSSTSDLSSKVANPVLDGTRATVWFGTEDGIYVFPSQENIRTTKNKTRIGLSAACLAIVYVDNKVFASLSNGDIVLIRREPRSYWEVTKQVVIPPLGTTVPASRLTVVTGNIWCARQNVIHVLDPVSLAWQHTFQISPDLNRGVTSMAPSGHAVWVATQNSDKLLLYHANSRQVFLEVSVMQAVAQKLSAFDDIIRQHKLACLHVTSLYSCKDLLWVGTSAGVILTITSPRLGSTPPKSPIPTPAITALTNGHAGQVRILTAVEMPLTAQVPPKSSSILSSTNSLLKSGTSQLSSAASSLSLTAPNSAPMGRRMSTSTATMATKMLVISGGEGYENLQNPASPGEDGHIGKEDNTNHILLWDV